MGRWGRADFKALKELEERIDKLEQVDFDRFCRETAAELADRLLAKVKKRTPVGKVPADIFDKRKDSVKVKVAASQTVRQKVGDGYVEYQRKVMRTRSFLTRDAAIYQQYWSGYKGGTLRGAWTILPIEKQGNTYVATIVNNTEYASYVEFGHRQRPGRYVPALGKRLKANWVKGRFMLTISEQELENQLPKLLEKKLYAFLKEVF